MQVRDQKLRFSIRKLTIGAVSVMFGAIIFGVSTNQVHAATTADANVQVAEAAENKDEAHQTPQAGADYNKNYRENIPAIESVDKTKQNNSPQKDANGTTVQVAISATNKTNGKTSTVEGANSIDKAILDVKEATDTTVTYTISNPTTDKQNVSVFTELPAWNGTQALTTVDPARVKTDADGNLVLGGNYADKGLSLGNFDLATGKNSSSGFGRSSQEAAKNPALIGGFQITGTLAPQDEATVSVPIKIVGTGNENGTQFAKIGLFFGGGNEIRLANVATDLNLQKDKHYFLVDADKSTGTDYYSIDQSVLNDLAKAGLSPLYEPGDVKFNNGDWFNTVASQQGNDQPIYYGAYLDISKAQERLKPILNSYGYDLANIGSLTGVGGGSAYVMKETYKYYDAQGNPIKLGTGNISNFMIAVKRVITNTQATVLDVNDSNYQSDLQGMFTDPSNSNDHLSIDSASVKINVPGVYPVKVTNDVGNISRIYKVVVVSYNTPETTKTGVAGHKEITAAEMISAQSLQELKDNGYTVKFAEKPSYSVAGKEAVKLIITGDNGDTHESTQYINVAQTVKINFVAENGKVIASTTQNGEVGTNLDVNAVKNLAESIPALNDYKLGKIPETKFLAQAADQVVNVPVTKQHGTLVVEYNYTDPATQRYTTAATKDFYGKVGTSISAAEILKNVPAGYYLPKTGVVAHEIENPDASVTTKVVYTVFPLESGDQKYKRAIHIMLEDGGQSAGITAPADIVQTITVPKHEAVNANDELIEIKDEGVIPAVKLPEIPGYTAKITEVPAITIAGGSFKLTQPFENHEQLKVYNVNVVYYVTARQRRIIYQDIDNDQEVDRTLLDGKIFTTTDFDTLSKLPAGYALANDQEQIIPVAFEVNNPNIIVNVTRLKSEAAIYRRKIQYKYENGTQAADDKDQTFAFIRKQHLDKAGHAVWGAWDAESYVLPEVVSPQIAGFTPDMAKVKAETITPEMGTKEIIGDSNVPIKAELITVTYSKKRPSKPTTPEQPVQPSVTPEEPTVPVLPETPDDQSTPENPDIVRPLPTDEPTKEDVDEKVETVKPHAQVVKADKQTNSSVRTLAHKAAAAEQRNSAANNELPQTGEAKTNLGIIGLLLAGLGLFGLASDRKRKN